MNDDIKILIQRYVKACSAGDKAKAHKIHETILRLQHQRETPLTPHEMVMAMTPSVHAYGAVT